MARKKEYPGGFRLTMATARKLAVQEFGTAKGLKQGSWYNSEGFYEMTMGNLEIEIHPDMSCSGCIQIDISMRSGNGHIFQLHDRETLDTLHRKSSAFNSPQANGLFLFGSSQDRA